MSKFKKILMISLALLVLLILFAGIYFALSFRYGGPRGFIAGLRKPPSELKLEKLRNETIIELAQVQEELGTISKLTFYEQTFSDMCAKGEHSWKRNDSFSHICAYRLTYYYGIDADTAYKDVLLELERNLSDIGWTVTSMNPKQSTISEVLSQYPLDGFLLELPEYRSNNGITLNINRSEGSMPFGFGVGLWQLFYKEHSDQSLKEIPRSIISQGLQPIMFSVSKMYFRN